ncbi:hypothetical protein PflQ2_2305 [Pseudomonas fluorescens Q2-87]|uniref:Uncharacterized protein n=1 Tax=Pseudomonas fluorescens (strain Q2-87) TaxID=1038922 RepID=J2Y4A9_PSEFQ|nr:hypothetical protein [Pseudomonas fluorescens]EJL01619.1 hypothetical protein PflQ2_2305 [Pseudomonas fluorescens Q2-87]
MDVDKPVIRGRVKNPVNIEGPIPAYSAGAQRRVILSNFRMFNTVPRHGVAKCLVDSFFVAALKGHMRAVYRIAKKYAERHQYQPEAELAPERIVHAELPLGSPDAR